MSIHYCTSNHEIEPSYNVIGTHDIVMVFNNEGDEQVVYKLPSIICHYVLDHCCALPEDFIHNIMFSTLVCISRDESEIDLLVEEQLVGYFSTTISTGEYPYGFVDKLRSYIMQVNNYC